MNKKEIVTKFKSLNKTKQLGLLVLVVAAIGLLFLSPKSKEEPLYLVTRVIDGDTIEIEMNESKEVIRLIGIDAPESVHPDKSKNTAWGKIAYEYTKNELEWRKVKLELDIQERDKYGRILAYVYVDDIMFNETLLFQGLASIYTVQPNVKYVENFSLMQKQAKLAERGIWSKNE